MKRISKKLVVIGPECTGKTNLSTAIAQELDLPLAPEMARSFLEQLNRPYEYEDLEVLAKEQVVAEQRAARKGKAYVCDTDLYVMKVWSEVRYNACSRYILEQLAILPCAGYLLTDIDLEWEYDPLREHPGEQSRKLLFQMYLDIVAYSGVPFRVVQGKGEKRTALGLHYATELLGL